MFRPKVHLARHRLPTPGRLAQLVLESSADFAVLTICLDGIVTSWNSAAERVMGWSEVEAVGQHACMIFTPEDQERDACGREVSIRRRLPSLGWVPADLTDARKSVGKSRRVGWRSSAGWSGVGDGGWRTSSTS